MGGVRKSKGETKQQQGPMGQLIPFIVDAAKRANQMHNRYGTGGVTPGMRPEHAYGGPGTSAIRPPGSPPMKPPMPMPPGVDVQPGPPTPKARVSGGKGK